MKINDDDLRRLYRDYLQEQRPLDREGCPPVRDLLALFRKQRRLKKGVLDHVGRCSYCSQEFEFIQGILKAEKELLEEIEPILKDGHKERETRGLKSFSDFRHKFIPYAVALAALAAVVGIFLKKDLVWRGGDAGQTSASIRMISPGAIAPPHIPLKFQWEGTAEYDHCVFELFDEALKPLWESPPISGNELVLPPEIREKLQAGRSYFWMITIVLKDGIRVESSLAKFSLPTDLY